MTAEATGRAPAGEAGFRLLGRPTGLRVPLGRIPKLIHPADREAVTARMERMRSDPSPLAFEFRIIRPDGGERTVLARSEGLRL